ncbi:MAG: FHA domain-containing protein [Flavobacteriaceae bacterium]|nr:FHA domain-containing protein [Flavobacteriaceae bacterium]
MAIDLKKGGEGGILIKDLKSANSTFISKREGGWEQLQEGEQIFLGSADRIRIGAHTQIRFDQVD